MIVYILEDGLCETTRIRGLYIHNKAEITGYRKQRSPYLRVYDRNLPYEITLRARLRRNKKGAS